MHQEFTHHNNGFIVETNGLHQPIIDGSQRKRLFIKDTLRSLPKTEGKPVLTSYGDPNLMYSSNHEVLPLTKRDFFTRKDTARKNLMGYLYTRQPALTRSNSFVAGEKPLSESVVFPRLNNTVPREKTSLDGVGRRTKRVRGQMLSENHLHDDVYEQQMKYKRRTPDRVSPNRVYSNSRPLSQKISLPDLIMDLNACVVEKQCPINVSESGSESDYQHEVSQEENGEVVPVETKQLTHGGKIFPARHRPITPGLLDKLAKLKLPSRIRTEQWVRRLPSDPRSILAEERIMSHTSKFSDSSNDDSKWIYNDT